MEYEDFEVQVGPRSGTGFLVRVLRSPAGEGEGILRLPDIGYGLGPGFGTTRHLTIESEAPALPASPAEIGDALYRGLFADQIGTLFHQSLSRIRNEAPMRGLRVRLRINPSDSSLDRLQSMPWELLYRKQTEDFLALSRLTPVVRALDLARPATPRPLKPPLRILVVHSQDPQGERLDLPHELAELTSSLQSNPSIEVEILDSPETRALRAVLGRRPFHVLHFMGHGSFDPESGEGALLFRGLDGCREAISGRHLATKIKDFGSLRLVVLNACDTALASSKAEPGPFAGVATALVLGGVPAVVAMQSPIEDSHAVAFSAAFYDRLAQGTPVDEAMTEGRQAVHSLHPDGAEWAVPVLFLRSTSGDLFAGIETAEPVQPVKRDQPRRSRRAAAGGVLIILLLATGALSVPRLREWADPAAGRSPQMLRPAVEAQATPLPVPPQTRSVSHAAKETEGHAPAGARTFTAGGLRFEISAPGCSRALSRTLAQALERAAHKLPLATGTGRTIHLDVEAPRLSGYSDSGVSLQSCALSASSRGDLNSVHAVHAAVDGDVACAAAAEGLAEAVIHQLAQLSKEETK